MLLELKSACFRANPVAEVAGAGAAAAAPDGRTDGLAPPGLGL